MPVAWGICVLIGFFVGMMAEAHWRSKDVNRALEDLHELKRKIGRDEQRAANDLSKL